MNSEGRTLSSTSTPATSGDHHQEATMHDDSDHPFTPGVDVDAPDQPDPRWCNTCGEARA